jgi:hypothetical protein
MQDLWSNRSRRAFCCRSLAPSVASICPRCLGLSFADLALPHDCQLPRNTNGRWRDAAAVLRAICCRQSQITESVIQYNTSHVRSSFGGLYQALRSYVRLPDLTRLHVPVSSVTLVWTRVDA